MAERFQEVDEAYEVLRDPEKRAAYDLKLRALGAVFDRPKRYHQKPLPQDGERKNRSPVLNTQVIWAAVGIILTVLAGFVITEIPDFVDMINFQREGIDIEAVVTEVEQEPAYRNSRYFVEYAYIVGEDQYEEIFVTRESSYRIGDSISLKYLPDDPSDAIRVNDMQRTFVAVIGGVFILIGLPIVLWFILEMQKSRQAHATQNPRGSTL